MVEETGPRSWLLRRLAPRRGGGRGAERYRVLRRNTTLIMLIVASLVALFLTTYLPAISLWLPRLVYPKSFL